MAALTLSAMIASGLEQMGQLVISKATGGSTTTIVDTTLDPDAFNEDDANKNGLAIILRDAGGANAAPEAEFSRITAYDSSTQTFTLEATLTASVATGDQYGFTAPEFTLQQMIRLANEALDSLGDFNYVDSTTLDTAVNTTEYAASIAWKRARPTKIQIQGRVGNSVDNAWVDVSDWELVPAAPGSTGKIIFRKQLFGSRDVKVWYQDRHPYVYAFSDKIDERVTPDLAKKAFILQVSNWRVAQDDGTDAGLKEKWNKAKNEFDEAMAKFPIERPRRQAKLLILGQPRDDDAFTIPAAP